MAKSVPSLRLHRPSGRAVVTLSDANTGRRKDFFLGAYGSPEAHRRYADLIASWTARGRVLDASSTPPPTPAACDGPASASIAALCLAYVHHIEARGGVSAKHIDCIKAALRVLRSTCGGMPVAEFGPLALQQVRQAMIAKRWGRNNGRRWTRSVINRRVRHIVRMFRWAVSHEQAPTALPEALSCVEPLKLGEFGVPEGKPVKPVPEAHIDAIHGHVSSVVWAMIQVQRYTGARAGEVCIMRPIDIDTTGPIWGYRPATHKNAKRGHDRAIYLGQRAQEAIKPLLAGRAVAAYLFDPRESSAERRAVNASKRRAANGSKGSPRRPDQVPTPTRTDRKIRDHFTTNTYGRTIQRACEDAGVPAWRTHQLRHLAATNVRKEFGPEAALVILGDRSTRLVDVYAEKNLELARTVAAKIG